MNHPSNRMTWHSFVFNLDCNDVNWDAPAERAQAWIRDWYQRAFAAGASVLVADVALPDVVETIDTPTGEIIGARFRAHRQGASASMHDTRCSTEPPERYGDSNRWYRTITELMAQGTDVLHLACEEGRRAGALVLGGMRMSDAHHGGQWQAESTDPLYARVVMEHPEWCNTWEDGSRDATLNYAVPEVQAHRLQILREMATNYDIDGLELDWMRWCRHFPAGQQRAHLEDLTHFVARVRAMLDEVATAMNRERMILGHRVPATLDESLEIGCDVKTWAQQGYADFLAPMDFLFNDLNMRTDEFVEAVAGTACRVYPSFGSTKYSFGHKSIPYNDGTSPYRPIAMRTQDQFRATAANWYAWKADGGSCFNMYLWPAEQQAFYTEAIAIMSDPQCIRTGPRHYLYLPVWKDHLDGTGPTGRHNAQRLTFGADTVGTRQTFAFRMADGQNGEKLDGLLRFRIYDATPGDAFTIDLNGVTIAPELLSITDQPDGEVWEEASDLPTGGMPEDFTHLTDFTWPAGLRFDIALTDCPSFTGDNNLGITLTRKHTAVNTNPVMEVLEVRVRSVPA